MISVLGVAPIQENLGGQFPVDLITRRKVPTWKTCLLDPRLECRTASMWWMTIPHIAIISGCLLAGNNPNTLEGVVGKKTSNPPNLKYWIFELVYDSRYEPAWIWHRGRNKRIWAMRLQQTHHASASASKEWKEHMSIKFPDWLVIIGFAWVLIVIPSTLALLTSFYTPREGLSCRSMTFLAYMICQLCLILLWVWNILLTDLVFDSEERLVPRVKTSTLWYSWIWWFFATVFVSCATFLGIGGTMMQVIGVHRNCLCDIPITAWHRRYDDQSLVISTNSKDDIHRARSYWKGTGIAAVSFLTFVSFIGWWYQKRLRQDFKKLIKRIDEPTMVEMQPLNGNLHGVNSRGRG